MEESMPSKHKAARINQKYDLSYYTLQVATWVVAKLQCLNSAGQASLKLCATHRISVYRTVHFMCAVPLTCTLAQDSGSPTDLPSLSESEPT